jgi:hypothetical protein
MKGALDASPDGTDYLVRNVEMRDVRIGKTCIQPSNASRYFEIDAATTKDLRYSCPTVGTADRPEALSRVQLRDGRSLVFRVEAPTSVHWSLQDIRGRTVREGMHHPIAQGIQVAPLPTAASIPRGVYRAVLRQGGHILSSSTLVLP